MSKQLTIHLFNCDRTYKLDVVEDWLNKTQSKLGFAFKVEKHNFLLSNMTEMSSKTIPQLDMDVAVFVVHAHESRLSINEENAGIGYAKLYKALLEKTAGKVLIVIGGDDNYKNKDEEDTTFISRWARRKISSQFSEEFIDGRKSFIFSWNKSYREIHKDALIHFFNSTKKFEYQTERKRVEDLEAAQTGKAGESTRSRDAEQWKLESTQRRNERDAPRPDSLKLANTSTAIDPGASRRREKKENKPLDTEKEGRSPQRGESNLFIGIDPLQGDTSANVSLRGYESLYTERGSSSHRMGKSDPLSGTDPLQSDTSVNVSLRGYQSVYNEKEGSSRQMRESDCLSAIGPQQGVSFKKAAPGGCAAHYCHVDSTFQDLPLSKARQGEKKDLSIIAWEASQEPLRAIFGLIDSCRDVLNLITVPKVLNFDVHQMKSYFEYMPSKNCVLVADAEKIKAVLTQEGENILKLLQTADRNVAEKIILTICLSRCRPERDKAIVGSAIKAAFSDNKKVYITWFEDGKLVANKNELVTFLTSSNFMANTSPQEKSTADDFNHRIYLGSGKTVLVMTRLRNGRISLQPEDVEYWKPGFIVPRKIVNDHAKYTNAELVILLDEDGSHTCQVNEKKGEERPDLKVLDSDETIMLETKLKHGQISLQFKHLVPQPLLDQLKETYWETPTADLYIASNSKGDLRCSVKVGKVSKAFTFINSTFNKATGKKVNLI